MNLAVTNIISSYHAFDRSYWLSYKALEKVMPKELWEELKMTFLRSKRIDKKYIEPFLELYDIEYLLLDKEWKEKSERDKQYGTETHLLIYNCFCNNNSSWLHIPEDYQVIATENFLLTEKGLFPEFRLEVKLDEDYVLVGIADLIIKDGNKIKIYDFKTSEDIKFKSRYDFGLFGNKMMKYPLASLMDANGIHYLLQLSIYAWMLKLLNPEFVIEELLIIQVRDMKVKKTFVVDYLEKEIDYFLKYHIKSLHLKTKSNECKTYNY